MTLLRSRRVDVPSSVGLIAMVSYEPVPSWSWESIHCPDLVVLVEDRTLINGSVSTPNSVGAILVSDPSHLIPLRFSSRLCGPV